MVDKSLPGWWPENPYPRSIFPASAEEIRERIGDDELVSAASGSMGRFVFEATSRRIWEAWQEAPVELRSVSEWTEPDGLVLAYRVAGGRISIPRLILPPRPAEMWRIWATHWVPLADVALPVEVKL